MENPVNRVIVLSQPHVSLRSSKYDERHYEVYVSAVNQFSSPYKGGQIAERSASQDTVALVVAVEVLGNLITNVPEDIIELAGRISFEKYEDIEVRWNFGALIVSVKDKGISYSELIRELNKFAETLAGDPSVFFRVEATGTTGNKARAFCEDLGRIHQVARTKVKEEIDTALADFERQHGISKTFVLQCEVSIRDLSRDSDTAKAIFATKFRSTFPVSYFSDTRIYYIYEEYLSKIMARARRRRETVSLEQMRRDLLEPLVPVDLYTTNFDCVRTPFGYVKDSSQAEAIHSKHKVAVEVRQRVIKRWKRHTRRDAIAQFLWRPRVKCPFCNYPLIRALVDDGLIICPRCKFQPYLTVFYACDCLNATPLIRQPNMDTLDTYLDLLSIVRKGACSCDECGQTIEDEKLLDRIFLAPVPWPIENYSEQDLIQIRIDMGWDGMFYKVKGETPLSLLEKGCWEKVFEGNAE